MEFRQLKYFVSVVEAGSFSRAAAHCNVVQSALSQQVALLEAELGQPLLIRSSKGVTMSHAGEVFFGKAQYILRQVEHARAAIATLDSEPAGPVSVGFPTSTAASLSLPFLNACLERYPKVQLHIMEGLSRHVLQNLSRGGVDIAVLFSGQNTAGLEARSLMTEELFLVGQAHRRRGSQRGVGAISVQALSELPLLLPERGNGLRDIVDQLFHSLALSMAPRVELGSLSTMVNAVKQGLGVTLLPWGAFAQEFEAGTLTAYRIEGLSMVRKLMLCRSSTLPLSDAAKAVTQLLEDVVAELIASGTWPYVHAGPRLAI